MGIKIAQTLEPVWAAARIPAAASGGFGLFHKPEFNDSESGYALPLLFENLEGIAGGFMTLAAVAENYFLPAELAGPKRALDLDKDYRIAHAIERGTVAKLGRTRKGRALDQCYGSAFNFRVEPTSDGGMRICVKAHSLLSEASLALSNYLNRAGISSYMPPVELDSCLHWMRQLGYDWNAKVNELDIDIPTLLGAFGDDLEDGFGIHILRRFGSLLTCKARLENSRHGETFEAVSYAPPYEKIEYKSIDDVPEGRMRNSLLFNNIFAYTTVEFYFCVKLTPEETVYVSQTEPDQVRITDVAEFVSQLFSEGLYKGTFAPYVTPIRRFEQIQIEANGGVLPQAPERTGVLGLMINPSTLSFVALPKDSSGLDALYHDQASVHIDPDSGAYQFKQFMIDARGEKKAVTTKERALRVDWVTNILTTNTNGKIEYLDISAWGPATLWHVRRFCEDKSLNKSLDSSHVSLLVSRAVQLAVKAGLVTKDDVLAHPAFAAMSESTVRNIYAQDYLTRGLYTVFIRIVEQYIAMKRRGDGPQWLEEIGDNENSGELVIGRLMRLKNFRADFEFPLFSLTAGILAKVADHIANLDDSDLCGLLDLSIGTVMAWRAGMLVWNEFCRGGRDAYQRLIDMDAEARASYGRQPEDQDDLPADFAPKALPNVRPDLKYMPHQAKGRYSLERNPKFAILNVAAGGGKTISIITDILGKLQDDIVRLPAVFCPSHLLSNYVEDANYATAGQVNVVPINTATVDNFGREYFEKLAKHGPKNMFFVIDYDFCKWNPEWVSYGSLMEPIYGNAQWLRSLGIDGIWCDEAHYLKNDSLRSDAVRQAIVDSKYRVLATGTMLATRLEDVVNQMAILDPGVFGTQERFNNMYGTDGSWVAQVNDFELGRAIDLKQWMALAMQANSCVVKGTRKEWAALLPPKTVRFYWVELSDGQRKVYEAILQDTLEEIKGDEKLMAMIEQQDEDMADQLEAMLQRYLQRIERFLSAPGADDLSAALDQADRKSPKGKLIGHIARQHIKDKIPGKILVFTSYIESAKAVLDALPEDIRSHALLYTADRKMACREQFEHDPNIWLMVGVEQSMNTGVNAQFASRLIRVESVYSPGILEQGESRINRPNIKKKEFRTGLYLDWVLVDRSIDVTKSGRLMWRAVDAEKFYNPTTPAYQDIADLKPIRLTIDSIMQNNSFKEELGDHLDAYLRLENVVKAGEIAEYKQRHPNLDFVEQPSSGVLEDSGLLKQIPYVPGGGLFDAEDLGLISAPEFMRLYGRDDLKGMWVHTDQGDGEVVRVNKDTLQVKIAGVKTKMPTNACFVITKKSTSGSEIRRALARNVGLNVIDVDTIGTPAGKKGKEPAPPKGPKPEPEQEPAPAPTEGGKLHMQVQVDGVWTGLRRLPDNRADVPVKKQAAFYGDFLTRRRATYAEEQGGEPGEFSFRLVDDEGNVVSILPATAEPTEPEQDELDTDADTHGDDSPVPDAVVDGAVNVLPCFYNEFFSLIINKNDQDLEALGMDPEQYGFVPARACAYVHLARWQHARDFKNLLVESGLLVSDEFLQQLDAVQEALRTGRAHFEQYRHLSRSGADLQLFHTQQRRKLSPKRVEPFITICDGNVFLLVDIDRTPAWPKLRSSVAVRGAKWQVDDESYLFTADTKAKVQKVLRDIARDFPIAEPEWVDAEVSKMSTATRRAELK